MLVFVIFVRYMRVGLDSVCQRELETYTTGGREWKPRVSSFISFVGLLSVAAVQL